jgi:hypothetical protein
MNTLLAPHLVPKTNVIPSICPDMAPQGARRCWRLPSTIPLGTGVLRSLAVFLLFRLEARCSSPREGDQPLPQF